MKKTLEIEALIIVVLIVIICMIPSKHLKKATDDSLRYQHVSNVTLEQNDPINVELQTESTIIFPNRYAAGYSAYKNDSYVPVELPEEPSGEPSEEPSGEGEENEEGLEEDPQAPGFEQ